MKFSIRMFLVMLFWMFIISGLVFFFHRLFNIPDEIAGPMLFLCIGMVISSTINYYK